MGAIALLIALSAAGHSLAANRMAARHDARALIGRLQLPPGAVRLARRPKGAVGVQAPLGRELRLVQVHGWWRVPGSMWAVSRFVGRHRPPGSRVFATGDLDRGWRIVGQALEFSWPAVPGVLGQRILTVGVMRLPSGRTAVKADAEVEWFVPRPASERVPRQARVLTVTRGSSHTWTITDPSKVEQVAHMLDGLQIVQPTGGFTSCGFWTSDPAVSLTFHASPGGPPLARAVIPAGGPEGECSPISFAVRGHHEPVLFALPSFRTRIGRTLGLSLH